MNRHVRNITIEGLHRTNTYAGSDISMDFRPGVNVVYGHNGSGKTTLLHILANAVGNDFTKFSHLAFHSISLKFSDDMEIKYWTDDDGSKKVLLPRMTDPLDINTLRDREDADRQTFHFFAGLESPPVRPSPLEQSEIETVYTSSEKLGSVAYFPAFRTMSEIIKLFESDRILPSAVFSRISEEISARAFGAFAPDVKYPSSTDIADGLKKEVERVVESVSRENTSILSNLSVNVLNVMPDVPKDTRDAIQSLVGQLEKTPIYAWLPEVATAYSRLSEAAESSSAEAASLYEDSMSRILNQQRSRYEHIQDFKTSVNEFLNDKELVITTGGETEANRTNVGIQRKGDSEGELIPLDTMSSGERQIISLLYSASFLGQHNIVLIDEPEISLHIDWQYQFAQAMARILGSKQLIVCTHSPELLTGFEDIKGDCHSIELDPIPSQIYR